MMLHVIFCPFFVFVIHILRTQQEILHSDAFITTHKSLECYCEGWCRMQETGHDVLIPLRSSYVFVNTTFAHITKNSWISSFPIQSLRVWLLFFILRYKCSFRSFQFCICGVLETSLTCQSARHTFKPWHFSAVKREPSSLFLSAERSHILTAVYLTNALQWGQRNTPRTISHLLTLQRRWKKQNSSSAESVHCLCTDMGNARAFI